MTGQPSTSGRPSRRTRVVLAGVLAAAVIAAPYVLDQGPVISKSIDILRSEQISLLQAFQRDAALTVIQFFLLYVAMSTLSLPGSSLMSLSSGAVFGFVPGVVVASIASSLGAFLSFVVIRRLLGDANDPDTTRAEREPNRRSRLLGGLNEQATLWLVALRLIPLVPFFLINVVFGMSRIPAWWFVGVSWLSMLPGTIAYVHVGTQLAHIQSAASIASPVQVLAASTFWLLTVCGLATSAVALWVSRQRS